MEEMGPGGSRDDEELPDYHVEKGGGGPAQNFGDNV